MNILFLTLLDFETLDERNLYTDLLREFVKNDHRVHVISPTERKKRQKTHIVQSENWTILKLKIGNTQKTNILEKGISTLCIEPQFIAGIKKYFPEVKFDLVLYSTPPITFCRAIEFVKKRDGARAYLLLKDIFPQNAVDIGILSPNGAKGLLYRFFRQKEKRLYRISDHIGCMSQANVDYVLAHNPEIPARIVEVCPNCAEPTDLSIDPAARADIRQKYGIPTDRIVYVYGGNLGKPQDIKFIISCLECQRGNSECFFLIVGDGTQYGKLEAYVNQEGITHVKLIRRVPREAYDMLIAACDVGLIFLDHRFTIPNFPSRMLGYMQARLPILACTDPNTDVGKTVTEGHFGWWCGSDSVADFTELVRVSARSDRKKMGEKGFEYLQANYSAGCVYQIIQDHLIRKEGVRNENCGD